MPATLEARPLDFLARLSGQVDAQTGLIRGATVAKSGVPAIGKFIYLDKSGNFTRDAKMSVKKLPVVTDEKTLDGLMGAAQDAGLKTKCREDHNDMIEARIGFCYNFKRTATDTVSCDIHVFKAYRNNALLFETAEKTPEMIGLSIDPGVLEFELGLRDGEQVALMRVVSLEAVDVVDAGAITPEGLLMKRGRVDTPDKLTSENPETKIPAHMPPTLEEIMTQMKTMADGFAAMTANVTACQQAIAKMTAPPAAVPDAAMAASLKDLSDKLAAQTTQIAQMKKEKALLGFSSAPEVRAGLLNKTAEEIEQLAASKKDYLGMVEERATTDKCSKSIAHQRVQATDEGKLAYREHLSARGVYDERNVVKKPKAA